MNAQDHHHVRAVDGIFKCFSTRSPLDELAEFVWYERAWTTDADIRAELCQQVDIRTRDARVQDVADDRDLQTFDSSFVFTNRERVEQRLRRMLVRAVAGVDDRRRTHAREMLRRAGHRMTNDDAIGRHRFEVARGVQQSLAFGDAGGRDADVDGVADRRLAAISKEVRVRVDGSKKRLMTVRPRSAGTFLISRLETSRNVSAVSSRCVISAARARECRAGVCD